MNQKLYWDNVASFKDFTTPFQMDVFQKLVPQNAEIIDIGCGYGRTLNELYNNGYTKTVGIDFSAKMIERGENTYPYLNLKTMSKETIDFSDNTFDAAILLAVLTCISDDNEQMKLLKEIQRILKPGGIIYINDFLLNDDERNIKRYNDFLQKYNTYGIFELPEGAVVRHYDKTTVEEKLSIFEKICFEETVYVTMNGNKSNGYYYFGKNRK
jgi:ubiquinone/menaquinone biosynthesis C-methylase UbiE